MAGEYGGWRTCGMWCLAKIATPGRMSAPLHSRDVFATHQTVIFLVVYGELHHWDVCM